MSILLQHFECFFGWVLRRTNTLMVKWRHSSFTGGGSSKVSHRALFQAGTSTLIESPKFRKLVGYLISMKESKVPGRIRAHSGEGQVVRSQ